MVHNTAAPSASRPSRQQQERGGPIIVIFDGSCDFCTATAGLLRHLDRRKRLLCLPFQLPGLPARYGLTLQQCEESVWAIVPDGARSAGAGHYRGAAAISIALDAILGRPLFLRLYRLPGVGRLEERLYRWIAAHRQYLPGVRPYCQRPGAPCGS